MQHIPGRSLFVTLFVASLFLTGCAKESPKVANDDVSNLPSVTTTGEPSQTTTEPTTEVDTQTVTFFVEGMV